MFAVFSYTRPVLKKKPKQKTQQETKPKKTEKRVTTIKFNLANQS